MLIKSILYNEILIKYIYNRQKYSSVPFMPQGFNLRRLSVSYLTIFELLRFCISWSHCVQSYSGARRSLTSAYQKNSRKKLGEPTRGSLAHLSSSSRSCSVESEQKGKHNSSQLNSEVLYQSRSFKHQKREFCSNCFNHPNNMFTVQHHDLHGPFAISEPGGTQTWKTKIQQLQQTIRVRLCVCLVATYLYHQRQRQVGHSPSKTQG